MVTGSKKGGKNGSAVSVVKGLAALDGEGGHLHGREAYLFLCSQVFNTLDKAEGSIGLQQLGFMWGHSTSNTVSSLHQRMETFQEHSDSEKKLLKMHKRKKLVETFFDVFK